MIEHILAFALGVSIVPLVWGVVVTFRASRDLKNLKEELQHIYSVIDSINKSINLRIDEEINRVDVIQNDCIRHTDSRVDKLESRTESKFNEVHGMDSELRQRINNINELVGDITGLNIKK